MKIFTGYFAKGKNYKENGLFTISVSKGKPKFFNPDHSYSPFMPTWEMVKMYCSESEYFLSNLRTLNAKEVQKHFETISKGKDIVLLCYEKNPKECHRSYISNWFKRNGIECNEYELQSNEKIKDPQLSLF